MEKAVDYIKRNGITDKFQVVQILMEQAEQLSNDGDKKKELVIQAYTSIVASDTGNKFQLVSFASIELIIEALIYASKTVIKINNSTGCLTKFMNLFKNN